MPELKRSKLSVWIQVARIFSFTASLTPVCIAAALAFAYGESSAWVLFPLVAACALLFHAGTNVVSEYFDFKKGVDTSYKFGSSRVLVDGLMPPGQVLIGGYALFAAGFLIGLILVAARGWPVFILGVIGLLGGLFYSASPIGYKYLGLGDVMVFLLMGPLMVIGAYFVLAGQFDAKAFYVSLPVGFLVTAILNANNIRDIKHDVHAGVKTLENILGEKAARSGYLFLVGAAYLSIVAMIAAKILSWWSLLVFLSAPQALKNMKIAARMNNPEEIAVLDVKTARLHFLFGVLLFISVILIRLTPWR